MLPFVNRGSNSKLQTIKLQISPFKAEGDGRRESEREARGRERGERPEEGEASGERPEEGEARGQRRERRAARGRERRAARVVTEKWDKLCIYINVLNRTGSVRLGQSVFSVQNRNRTEPDFFSIFLIGLIGFFFRFGFLGYFFSGFLGLIGYSVFLLTHTFNHHKILNNNYKFLIFKF